MSVECQKPTTRQTTPDILLVPDFLTGKNGTDYNISQELRNYSSYKAPIEVTGVLLDDATPKRIAQVAKRKAIHIPCSI